MRLTDDVRVVAVVAVGSVGCVGPDASSRGIRPNGFHVPQHVPLVVLGLRRAKVEPKCIEGRCDLPGREFVDGKVPDEENSLPPDDLVADEGQPGAELGEGEVFLGLEVL